MDSISLPVIDPKFEKLKNSGVWLHLTAGLLILSHALSHFHRQESPAVYFWCQLIISLDIFILVLAGRDLLRQMPNVNLFFRIVEIVFFLGIGLILLMEGNWTSGIIHLALSLGYSYLFRCERATRSQELLSIHHIGISIPGLPERRFFPWTHINDLEATYNSIHISTSLDLDLDFDLRKNLEFAELEQIREFCRHYLGK